MCWTSSFTRSRGSRRRGSRRWGGRGGLVDPANAPLAAALMAWATELARLGLDWEPCTSGSMQVSATAGSFCKFFIREQKQLTRNLAYTFPFWPTPILTTDTCIPKGPETLSWEPILNNAKGAPYSHNVRITMMILLHCNAMVKVDCWILCANLSIYRDLSMHFLWGNRKVVLYINDYKLQFVYWTNEAWPHFVPLAFLQHQSLCRSPSAVSTSQEQPRSTFLWKLKKTFTCCCW